MDGRDKKTAVEQSKNKDRSGNKCPQIPRSIWNASDSFKSEVRVKGLQQQKSP